MVWLGGVTQLTVKLCGYPVHNVLCVVILVRQAFAIEFVRIYTGFGIFVLIANVGFNVFVI
jgi:hypothetical protein